MLVLIIINLKCGLGNQLFQYSTGKAVAKMKGTTLKLYRDPINLGEKQFNLDKFVEDFEFISEDEVDFFISGVKKEKRLINWFVDFVRKSRILLFLARRLRSSKIIGLPSSDGVFDNRKVFLEDDRVDWTLNFREDIFLVNKDCFLRGFFPSYKYFDFIKEDLIEELSDLKVPLSDIGRDVKCHIERVNSISIHIRRGDAVSIDEVSLWYKDVINEEYYKKAIDYFLDKIENPVFFIFSNDMDWVRDNFKLPENYRLVDHNDAEHGYEDLYLMSCCQNNITTGFSSFAWWAAYLNRNSSKIVLRAREACGIEKYNYPEDYYPPDWIVVE